MPRVTPCRTATHGRGRVRARLNVRGNFAGLVLPGLPNTARGLLLTLAVLTAALLSRLLLLPDGPWEQDEALFAAGVLDFDVTRHRPHPPGFPGWIAVGRLVRPLTGDPVRALQVASSVASAVLLWALARLLGHIVDGGRATALAVAFTASPLAWVHGGRAFSTTPALACGSVALLLFLERRSPLLGWALLGLAATLRPQLAPELALVAGLGIATAKRRRATLLGVGLGLAFVLAGCVVVAASGPSFDAVRHAFVDHFARHRGGLVRNVAFAELGIVRGLLHPLAAGGLLATATVGLGLGLRSKPQRRGAAWVLALVAVTAWMVLVQHHPGFPRYAVALLLVCMPALAWTLAALPSRLGWVLAALASIVGASASAGILLWMHAAPLPVVAAARLATADPSAQALAYSHGVFSFARLQAESAGVPGIDVVDPDAPIRLPQHAYALEGRTLHTLEGVTACTLEFPTAPAQAMRLGQGRFDRARLSRDAVILGPGIYTPETDDAGDRYAWMGDRAQLHLPAAADRLRLRVEVPGDLGGATLTAQAGLAPTTHRLAAGPASIDVDVAPCPSGCTVTLEVDRRHDAQGDPRALTVRLEAAWVEGESYRPAYARWSPGHPRTLRAHGVALRGFEQPETFARGRRGAWTHAEATASMPARPGTLSVLIARPEHTPGEVTVQTDAESRTLAVGPQPTELTLRTNAPQGRAQLRLATPTFTPADVREGSTDTRALGLIVYEVAFVPEGDPCHR